MNRDMNWLCSTAMIDRSNLHYAVDNGKINLCTKKQYTDAELELVKEYVKQKKGAKLYLIAEDLRRSKKLLRDWMREGKVDVTIKDRYSDEDIQKFEAYNKIYQKEEKNKLCIAQIGELLDRSSTVLRYWIKRGRIEGVESKKLYTEKDVAKIKEYSDTCQRQNRDGNNCYALSFACGVSWDTLSKKIKQGKIPGIEWKAEYTEKEQQAIIKQCTRKHQLKEICREVKHNPLTVRFWIKSGFIKGLTNTEKFGYTNEQKELIVNYCKEKRDVG